MRAVFAFPCRRLAAAVLLAGVVVSCGGAEAPLSPPADGVLRVIALDTLDFDAEQYEARPGEITIQYVLDGMQGHSLVVEGHEDRLRLVVSGGSTDVGSIDLGAGRYILYCDIPGHREGGMEARLLVS